MELWVVLLLLVAVVLAAGVLAWLLASGRVVRGGSEHHIVVDTLNLAHWYAQKKKIESADIVRAITRTAPALRKRYAGEVVYVLKDSDSGRGGGVDYEALARREKIQIVLVLKDAPASSADFRRPTQDAAAHSARGRDDFAVGMLAWKLRCRALTNDGMRDFEDVKKNARPFIMRTLHWARRPTQVHITPHMVEVRRPRRLRFSDALCPPLRGSKCAS